MSQESLHGGSKPRDGGFFIGSWQRQRPLWGKSTGPHSTAGQDAAQQLAAKQHSQQPGHAKLGSVQRTVDEICQMIANLSKVPVAGPLVSVAVQTVYFR